MFAHLLVPLDGSSLAEQALARVAAIGKKSKAEVQLIFVNETLPLDALRDAGSKLEEVSGAYRYLESIAVEVSADAGVRATHAVRRGDPVDEICRRATEIGADLIVMTSHGRTGLSRAWLGSVADGVIRRSKIPVLMLRPAGDVQRPAAAAPALKRVLVPLDGSDLSAEVLAPATALARSSGACLVLLRVVQPVPQFTPDGGRFDYLPAVIDGRATTDLVDTAKEQLTEVARRLRDESGLDVDVHIVVEPRVAPAILAFASDHEVDVIAMATHGRGASRWLVGSVADKVLRGSEVAMLLFRPSDVSERRETNETSVAAVAHA